MDSKNQVSPYLVTLVPQLTEVGICRFDQYYNPKYFIDQSPALPLVTNMAPFRPFQVILVIERQRNQWD